MASKFHFARFTLSYPPNTSVFLPHPLTPLQALSSPALARSTPCPRPASPVPRPVLARSSPGPRPVLARPRLASPGPLPAPCPNLAHPRFKQSSRQNGQKKKFTNSGLKRSILVHSSPATVLWPFLIRARTTTRTSKKGSEKVLVRVLSSRKGPEKASQKRFFVNGPHPQYGWDFPEEFRKNSGKTPETLSERFLEFPSRVRLGCPKPCNSRHLRLPEHFQNFLPLSTAGDASFFRSGSGEGLSELVMEFPTVLGAFLSEGSFQKVPRAHPWTTPWACTLKTTLYEPFFQKNPRFRKILVRNSGAGNGCANFMGA